MATFSPLCDVIIDITTQTNHYRSRNGERIDKISIHHMAGNLSVETCGRVFLTREASANYVAIATPHVAGYSADGKANATRMSLEAVAQFVGVDFVPQIVLPDAPCLSVETLLDDSRQLKQHPDRFEEMRGNYPVRREYF